MSESKISNLNPETTEQGASIGILSSRLEKPADQMSFSDSKKQASPKKQVGKKKSNPENADIPSVKAEVVKDQAALVPLKKVAAKAEKLVLVNEKLALAQFEADKLNLSTATSFIRSEVEAVAKSFCKIGYYLYQVKEGKWYRADGFMNIAEYGERYFNFRKSSTANYISICERFSTRVNGKPSAQLMDNFRDFSYTQLSEMLSLPAEKVESVNPGMTVKSIRGLKKDSAGEGDTAEKPLAYDPSKPCAPPIELFSRVLTAENLTIVIKLLRENIGKDISIFVEVDS